MAWDEAKKQAVVAAYEAADPTAENSMEIVKELAEEYEESPNGVRMILTKAGVYIKKAPGASAGKSATATASGGGTRVSKASAVDALVKALSDAGQEADMEIVEKLTGKAAQYFAAVITAVNGAQ